MTLISPPLGGLSHVRGPVEAPLLDLTIGQLLARAVAEAPGREALVFPAEGIRLSYAEFAREVEHLAAGLLALGIKKGDRVGIWSPNRSEWVLTQFATARIGAILVNINPAYRLSELEYALTLVGCRMLVTASAFKSSDYLAMIRELAPELGSGGRPARLPDLEYVVAMGENPGPGLLRFTDLLATGAANAGGLEALRSGALEAGLSPDDPINIQFTSGTTGRPKGATLSHRNIVNNGNFVTDRIRLTASDRLAIPVPLYHCFGMVMGVLGAVAKGATMVFPGEGFEPAAVLDAVEAERCTALYGVPTMFVAMLQELEQKPRDLASLRTGIMAGALCPVEVMKKVQSLMHMTEVTICYGMTETSPVSFQSFTDDPLEKRCETVGRVHPHLEVKVIGEDGATLPVGAQGELCTKGYSVMSGYWNDPTRSAEAIFEGWMRTGDLARIDAEGFCRITGRLKDLIIRGGENIYPREIEEFLMQHPGVADAQVFGIPDARFGEQVCAWLVPALGAGLDEAAVRAHCQGQIAHFKVPKHIRIVTGFPLTVTGKPQKFVMRDEMIALLGEE